MLLPSVRRLHRDRHTIQLGLGPGRSVAIELARPAAVLGLLDGTRSEPAIHREAARIGLPEADTTRLLGTLRRLGLVVEADALLPPALPAALRRRLEPEATALALRHRPPTGPALHSAAPAPEIRPARALARRQRARVVLCGRGRLAAPIGALLAAAGVGHVHPALTGPALAAHASVGGLLPADARRPARTATADALLRVAPEVDTRAVPPAEADLLVLVGAPDPVPAGALTDVLDRVGQLPVWVRDGTVVVGPLVRPGRSACLRCVHLHRRDRDPHWSVLSAQLCTTVDPVEPCETTTLTMGAALAAEQVLAELDGADPDALGRSLEVSAPAEIRRRAWPPHPECGCLEPRPTPGPAGGP